MKKLLKVRVVAIVQARMGSTRFPGKVMQQVDGKPMIQLLLNRLSETKSVDQIILATTDDPSDDQLCTFVSKLGYEVFRGDSNDVLDRVYQAALEKKADFVVRITGDCPLVDPQIVDQVVAMALDEPKSIVTNSQPPTFPDGLDVEAFSFGLLAKAWSEARSIDEREHVTPYLYAQEDVVVHNIRHLVDLSHWRWTVDEPVDLRVVREVFDHFAPDHLFSWTDVLSLTQEKPEIFVANAGIRRTEGSTMDTGQKLWRRAKQIIPGGNMLLSKRPELYAPECWPPYYAKAKGCYIWDLDDRQFTDVSLMGVGTNTLGYGYDKVDKAVISAIEKGNLSTLNNPEEVELAERLIQMHPWSGQAKFARTGGEANAIALRIARAASGKNKVAVCGYHGWHDWYVSANLADHKNLDGHLLPGLKPSGVPRELRGSTLPFLYNDAKSLESLFLEHEDIGVIFMEVQRSTPPDSGFLKRVRQIATKNRAALVFDECTSGFRETFGGLHLKYGVFPDVATFGKALGNGYAITAIIGSFDVMSHAQDSFISSTFLTERIGPSAALATLEAMEELESWNRISKIGLKMKQIWLDLANDVRLSVKIEGIDALPKLIFESNQDLAYRTLITQELLKVDFLASASFYSSISHTDGVLDSYREAITPVFRLIRECEEGRPVAELLEGPLAQSGFARLA